MNAPIKKIDSPIVDFGVKKPGAQAEAAPAPVENTVEHMHEGMERPEMLEGSSYKIKTPLSEHALYVTINDVVLNAGTEHEMRRPFEVFINSKNMDHFQWIVALTRIVSAVFRKGGDSTFLVEELKAVFDPQGGYFKKGGKFMPSLVAEIGDVIERHMKKIGMIAEPELDEHQKAMIAEKRAEYERRQIANSSDPESADETVGDGEGYPANATACSSCHTKAVVMMDGCEICLSCTTSRCS